VSLDDGKTWQDADLTQREKNKDKTFSWTLWRMDIPANQSKVTAMVRAVDSDGTVQNGRMEDMFNARGLLNTSPHTISFGIKK